jgi:hypothetical protein
MQFKPLVHREGTEFVILSGLYEYPDELEYKHRVKYIKKVENRYICFLGELVFKDGKLQSKSL